MSEFHFRLKQLIEQSGKKQNEICKELGVSKQKLSKWKTAYSEPNLDEVVVIARYFEVTTDYLLGAENEDGTKNGN